MELNLGELVKIEIELQNPSGFNKARVNWIFAYAEITGGRITGSKYGEFWVQLPRPELKNGHYIKPIKIHSKELEEQLAEETIKVYKEKLQKEGGNSV